MYETIVRDKIQSITRTVQGEEHKDLLIAKIAELTAAYRVEQDMNRLADIMEILITLIGDVNTLSAAQIQLYDEQGGYAAGHIAEVSAPHTHEEAASTQVSVKAVIWRNNKLVCARKQDAFGGQWEIPGGRLALNADPIEVILKEIQEELGVNANAIGSVVASGFADHLPGFLPLFYILYEASIDSEAEIALSDEHSAWSLFGRKQIEVAIVDGSFNPALGRMVLNVWPENS